MLCNATTSDDLLRLRFESFLVMSVSFDFTEYFIERKEKEFPHLYDRILRALFMTFYMQLQSRTDDQRFHRYTWEPLLFIGQDTVEGHIIFYSIPEMLEHASYIQISYFPDSPSIYDGRLKVGWSSRRVIYNISGQVMIECKTSDLGFRSVFYTGTQVYELLVQRLTENRLVFQRSAQTTHYYQDGFNQSILSFKIVSDDPLAYGFPLDWEEKHYISKEDSFMLWNMISFFFTLCSAFYSRDKRGDRFYYALRIFYDPENRSDWMSGHGLHNGFTCLLPRFYTTGDCESREVTNTEFYARGGLPFSSTSFPYFQMKTAYLKEPGYVCIERDRRLATQNFYQTFEERGDLRDGDCFTHVRYGNPPLVPGLMFRSIENLKRLYVSLQWSLKPAYIQWRETERTAHLYLNTLLSHEECDQALISEMYLVARRMTYYTYKDRILHMCWDPTNMWKIQNLCQNLDFTAPVPQPPQKRQKVVCSSLPLVTWDTNDYGDEEEQNQTSLLETPSSEEEEGEEEPETDILGSSPSTVEEA